MTISARQLHRDLDGLAYPARQRLLATTARTLSTSDLARLLDTMYEGDPGDRRIGLQLAEIARHTGYVLRCLEGAANGVVLRAAVIAVRLNVGGDTLRTRFGSLPTAHRHAVLKAVRRHGSVELAEALLPAVRERFGDLEAAALLPACSAPTLVAALPDLGYAVTGWARIGRQHPHVFLDHLERELAATPEAEWPALLARLGAGLAAVATSRGGQVLDILDRCAIHAPVPAALDDRVGALARLDPVRFLQIMLRPGRRGALPAGRSIWRALLAADDADLVRWARASGTGALPRFLHVLPPSRRVAIYQGVVGDRDVIASGIPLAALDELPRTARGDHARHLLGLRSVADDPQTRLAVTARLPWPEAEGALRSATRRATADERAAAYPLYIAAAAATREREVVEQSIASLTRLPNEQEPVRSPALEALAQIPAWLYTRTAARDLATVLRDAAHARDTSWRSQRAMMAVADRLIREGAVSDATLIDIGVAIIEMLGDTAASLHLHALDRALPHGAEHRVFEALRARIDTDARKGRFAVALALASGLRRRAWAMPALQAVLDQARSAKDDSVVRRAIELWLEPPATRDERVAVIVRSDRSTITIEAVRKAIGWRRTDLLDDVLTKPLHGRFLKRGVRHVPMFSGGFDRWLPRQRAKYAEMLVDLATAPRTSTYERASAVRQLGSIPGDADTIRAFLADQDVQVVDAALGALAWTDDPARVLPDLLAYADTDRAHVAVSAATRCARFVAPDALAAALSPALQGRKVTARKEAVRLLAAHLASEAVSSLSAVWAAPDQHRDVRRAVLAAARWLLADERVWALLAQGSADDDLAPAVLALHPDFIAIRHRTRYAELVRTVAGSATTEKALLGLAALPNWSRWDEGGGIELLVHLCTDLSPTATWRAALAALVRICETASQESPLSEVTSRLLAHSAAGDSDEAVNAATDRDQPARQRIDAVAAAVEQSISRRSTLRRAAGLLADAVGTSAPCADIAVRLAVAGVAWDALGGERDQLGRVIALADRPVLAWEAGRHVHASVRRHAQVLDQLELQTVVRGLVDDDRVSAGIVALAIIEVGGDEAGWPEGWRSLTRHYRMHRDPDVRLAAMRISTAAE